MSLLRQGKAQVLTIYLGESDQWHGKPLYVAMVQFLREQGCAGATVTRALAGYGAESHLHKSEGWHWSSDAPLVIQVVDQPTRLRHLLPQLQEMLDGGLMTLQEIEVLKYTHARSHGLPTKLQVRQVMATTITTVSPEAAMTTVIDLLLHAAFRVLPVVDEQRYLQGIISTGDLITAGVLPMRRGLVRTALALDNASAETVETPLEQARQSSRLARDIMNKDVRSIAPTQSIREAARIMLETGLRRLPVVEANGTLVGILGRADLLQVIVTSPLMNQDSGSSPQPLGHAQQASDIPAQQQPVANYVTRDVVTVDEQAPIADVIDALIISPFKRVIVVDEAHRVRGIISDVDVLARMQEEVRPRLLTMLADWARGIQGRLPTGALRTPQGQARIAADIMNREVVTVPETTSVQETIEHMIVTRRKVLPVVDAQGRLVGVVGRSDLLPILL